MFKDWFLNMTAVLKTAEVAEYLDPKHKLIPEDAFNEMHKFIQAEGTWKKKRAKAFALVVSQIQTNSFAYQLAEPYIKADKAGENLLPMLNYLCDIFSGNTTTSFMSSLEQLNEGWTPSEAQNSLDLLQFIEEQYKLTERLSMPMTVKSR
jgi:hypothetical protein